jgi:hypothetical protein
MSNVAPDDKEDNVGRPTRRWQPDAGSGRESGSLRTRDVAGGYAGWRSERLERFATGLSATRNNDDDGGVAGPGSSTTMTLRKRAGPAVGEASKGCTLHNAQRTTNPLEPEYEMTDRDGHVVVHGRVDGSTARPARGPRNNAPDFSLSTRDVNRDDSVKGRTGRRQRRLPNYIGDIAGAAPGPAMRPCKKVPPPVDVSHQSTPAAFVRAREFADEHPAAGGNAKKRGHGRRRNQQQPEQQQQQQRGRTGVAWWPRDDADEPNVPLFMTATGSPRRRTPVPDAVDVFSATWSSGRPTTLATGGYEMPAGPASARSRSTHGGGGGGGGSVHSRRSSRASSTRAEPAEIAQVRALP